MIKITIQKTQKTFAKKYFSQDIWEVEIHLWKQNN